MDENYMKFYDKNKEIFFLSIDSLKGDAMIKIVT